MILPALALTRNDGCLLVYSDVSEQRKLFDTRLNSERITNEYNRSSKMLKAICIRCTSKTVNSTGGFRNSRGCSKIVRDKDGRHERKFGNSEAAKSKLGDEGFYMLKSILLR